MEYWWRYGSGPERSAGFADRAEAEEWVGSAWSDLREQGVDEVTLLADEDELYGPMSLHPPD
ncbi:hypothetical protein [Actinophytocola sp.]|uniref:hypothetical protein n=1 Tax=Actinophytocola sp. TaxID=1872138 RepID=UPI003D6BA75F